MRAIERVGQAVNLAVERFVTVGESLADDNPDIKIEMYDACKETRTAGMSIERLCELSAPDIVSYHSQDETISQRRAMVRAARSLLEAVTRVLLLADIVVVKQLLLAKDKVAKSLGKLESVANFAEFVRAFAFFGSEMVELAQLTGYRQNDLIEERRKAQMTAARQVLERSTLMLLTSSKTCLRHLECTIARENRDTVFCQMRRAMDLIHFVVKDGIIDSEASQLCSQSQPLDDWDAEKGTIYTALQNFSYLVKAHGPRKENLSSTNNQRSISASINKDDDRKTNFLNLSHQPSGFFNLTCHSMQANGQSYLNLDRRPENRSNTPLLEPIILNSECRDKLVTSLEKVFEKVQDFTDSAYTSHENRQSILLLCDRCKLELNQCLRVAVNIEQHFSGSQHRKYSHNEIGTIFDNILSAIQDLSDQLAMSVLDQANDLHYVLKMGIELVSNLHNIAVNQGLDSLQERADRFHDYCDQILDICKLLRHISLTERLQVQAKFSEINLRIYGPQVITAARILSAYPTSKIAKENFEVFADMWQWLARDILSTSKEILDLTQSHPKTDKLEYLSLPHPGKHGTTSKPLKSDRLDREEQEKIADSGLEMKMLTNEMDAETEKWNGESDENNDIVKRAKNMSQMAFTMYQFTKGDGTLRTTQDLFTQAEYFAEEANRLYKVVRQFSYQVPAGQNKKELLEYLDKIPTYVQSLQFTVKEHTVGKAATFVKVDKVITETKTLMNVISKVVNKCFECANKYKLDFSGLSGRTALGTARDDDGGCGLISDSKGSTTSTEGSM